MEQELLTIITKLIEKFSNRNFLNLLNSIRKSLLDSQVNIILLLSLLFKFQKLIT